MIDHRVWHDHHMGAPRLSELLKLPAVDRAELAIVLWASLDDSDRAAALELTDDERQEFDRRWAAHLADLSTPSPGLQFAPSFFAESPIVRRYLRF